MSCVTNTGTRTDSPALAVVSCCLAISAAGLSLTGCESYGQTCWSASTHFLSERPFLEVHRGYLHYLDTAEGLTAYCEETRELAASAGCADHHRTFVRCLGSVEPTSSEAGWAGKTLCEHEVFSLEACLDGVPFESGCDDALDDEGDGVADCYDPDCRYAGPCARYGTLRLIPQRGARDVDLLLVIDNAGSMAPAQDNLRASFGALLDPLRATVGGMPNLHLGVTSTDLGTEPFPLEHCEPGGDGGRLLIGDCANPSGAPYLVDVAPTGCAISREPGGACSAHDCDPAACDHEPSTTLVVDPDTGCPRCRNYAGESLEEALACIADLGTTGCGFGQPLEAMAQALDPASASNLGFVRPDAHLAVVFVSDEDDCSAASPQLFNDTETDIFSAMGPLTTYRCFEFGITCNIDARGAQGLRQHCVPRDDPSTLLHPIDRYVSLLQSIKDPTRLLLAAIAGPVTDSSDGIGHDAVVGRDDQDHPALQFSCSAGIYEATGGAVPAIRLVNLIDHFHRPTDALHHGEDLPPRAYLAICSPDYTPALADLGDTIGRRAGLQCLPAPPAGCADVGVEFGAPRAPTTCAVNERCLADCAVEDVFARGTEAETRRDVPPCLEVTADGTLAPGNTDRSRAYENGHPPRRDASLPVSACWHIRYNALCSRSNYAELVISRQQDPPPRSFAGVACHAIDTDEHLCHDGIDNDQDCLTDADDPCCQSAANCVEG
jgi:hypothetical protein